MNKFIETLNKNNIKLYRETINTLQINMGKLCNQACFHCHVEAGPKRTEIMNISIIKQILLLLKKKNNKLLILLVEPQSLMNILNIL